MKVRHIITEAYKLNKNVMYQALDAVRKMVRGDADYDSLPEFVQDLLLDAFSTEMPYGTQKGRTGTPDEWYIEQIDRNPEEFMKEFETNLRSLMARENGHSMYGLGRSTIGEGSQDTTTQKYGVYTKGGSIGSKSVLPVQVFDTKAEATAKAKRLRKHLTKGERGYYKMGYVVRSVK